MQGTPVSWRLLLEAGWQGYPDFKVMVGGEALPKEVAEALVARRLAVWNLYGPTETTVWSTTGQVREPGKGIRIGTGRVNSWRITTLGLDAIDELEAARAQTTASTPATTGEH